MEGKITSVAALLQDDNNLNLGTERGEQSMEQSFKNFGAGRSIRSQTRADHRGEQEPEGSTQSGDHQGPCGRDDRATSSLW